MRCCHHFRTRHPWLDPKTAGIHAGRPPGVRMRIVCAASRRSKTEIDPSTADHLAIQIAHAFDFRSLAAAIGNRKPRRGGGHGWPPFSDRGRRPSPKIASPPTRLERLVGEGAFFWLLFFAPAKKSNSPAGESSAPKDATQTLRNPAGTSLDPRPRLRGGRLCAGMTTLFRAPSRRSRCSPRNPGQQI